ncbi:phosphotransferase [Cryobacterium melibiosiphilum]|uniref:Maltokinase n=1 Tax=Cryobacterium melibiosiphilum TaxID=995039 RepID=A0A3A5MMX3_9MICO|nr:phosphotransferase [Cryobacterium melibiosiphilum]RJT88253.1 phosphotransferase [Cryobacterium melibiosiphilum]
MTATGTSTPSPALLPPYLNEWVARQRWFASKGSVPALASIGEWSLPTPDAGVRIRTLLVYDTRADDSSAGAASTLYQLPLTERTIPLPGGDAALIYAAPIDAAGPGLARYLYDAPHDPAYAAALLSLMLRGGASPAADNDQADAAGESEAGTTAHDVTDSRVLRGEQSNTSIIYDVTDAAGRPATPIICKVFRALHPGENPDVAVQTALARAGSRLVPQPVGSVSGHWTGADPHTPDAQTVRGHLAFAQEFLPGVEDAWRTALTAAQAGTDFSTQARSLGAATADVHFDLARVMPSQDATATVRAATIAGMRDRYRAAVREVPQLAEHAASVDRIFDRAETANWPALQRIHGDYHLGQVLNVPGRGWALVDFEGEPLKPLNERVRPDVPLRDVAGMLRSFAYAASTIAMDFPDHDPAAIAHWAAECRTAFLEGYATASGHDLFAQSALLDAFELDKAVYETVYETRNRPTWLPIPLAAVRALCAAAEEAPPP